MPAAVLLVCLVFAISDGDTLNAHCATPTGIENIRVRLAGIDAPERAQPFENRYRKHLAQLAFQKEALVETRKLDRYGRQIATVRVAEPGCVDADCPKTLDVGMVQLTVGLAWWYRRYANEQPPQERGQYEFAEVEARGRGTGLWSDAEAKPPWEWRKRGRPDPVRGSGELPASSGRAQNWGSLIQGDEQWRLKQIGAGVGPTRKSSLRRTPISEPHEPLGAYREVYTAARAVKRGLDRLPEL